MQLGSVYLYPNRLDVYTNLDSWVTERYRNVYQRNLKVYRGTDNKIEFRVKNSDQKPKNVSGKYFVVNVVSRETQELVLSKDCNATDLTTGRIYLLLTQAELINIEPGFYQYTLVAETRTGIDANSYLVTDRSPVYVDTQFGATGVLEVLGDVAGDPLPSTEVTEFSYFSELNHSEAYSISSIIPARAPFSTPQSLHTFQLYMNNYTGRVIIQASVDEGGNPQTWSDVYAEDFVESGMQFVNITGKYKWFRVKYIAAKPGIMGTFTVDQTIFFNYIVSVNAGGRKYPVGTIIRIKGSKLGGETPTHDLLITVTGVGTNGEITSIAWNGLSYNGVGRYTVDEDLVNSGSLDKVVYR